MIQKLIKIELKEIDTFRKDLMNDKHINNIIINIHIQNYHFLCSFYKSSNKSYNFALCIFS